ncbi:uncharacterized protein EV422DRAFT_340934 [Fimicolochytrium jonesii]|uniref:uncharacterized protein n=1 Tax=Fimicolochytrium jonesii TaxID=1396493 RepID=UPI0022FEF140|nr:uncharacterized protein EV422DRAFT_340934 [Fimicolochytrium jonesii]KAI8815802.1 hypothetical protein EV422DRAFT_340934 [Fimicolochytrium jonesii]
MATMQESNQNLPAGVDKGFGKMVSDLGKKLSRRQGVDELVQRNIMREDEAQPGVSNYIIQQKASLEAEKTKDTLNRKIGNRPASVDLKLRNILRVESSDNIQQLVDDAEGGSTPVQPLDLQRPINFEERKEAMKSILKKRPEKEALEELNILKNTSVDPSLAAAQERLRKSQLADTLDSRLRDRPDVDQLRERRILNFAETVEVLPTFRKSEYNRKPDGNATFRKLTPQMKVQIREELNTFKKHEMPVHEQSLRNTCFH